MKNKKLKKQKSNGLGAGALESLSLLLRGLTFCMVLLTILLAVYFFMKINGLADQEEIFSVKEEKLKVKTVGDKKMDLAAGPEFSEYAKIFENKDLFRNPFKSESLSKKEKDKMPAPEIKIDVSRKYKLVGIFMDTDPQIVVEVLKDKETLFLRQGQKLGEMELKRIEPGKVIFLYHDQEIEMVP